MSGDTNEENRLESAELEYFGIEIEIVINNILHGSNARTLLKEANRFFNAAKKIEEGKAIGGQFQFAEKVVPALTMRLGVPKIP